jgi:hypothetical protein
MIDNTPHDVIVIISNPGNRLHQHAVLRPLTEGYMNNKGFWYFLMSGSIALFACSLWLGYYLFPEDCLLSWSFFLGLLALHIAEIPMTSLKIGKEKNIAVPVTIIKTLLFGFTWWLPLKKGIIKK